MSKSPARFHSLLHSAYILEKRLTRLLAPLGVRPRQARILNALDSMGAASQVTLSREFGVTAGSMSTMIDRLLALGLVSRHKDKFDRRGDVIALTPKGEQMLIEVRAVWKQIDDLLESKLGVAKTTSLIALTRELKGMLGGRVPGRGLPYRSVDDLVKGRVRKRHEEI